MSSSSSDSGPPEWQAARDVLDKFDERLHDLRKYGFSFITGLLSVDAIFAAISASWKLAALIATLALIVSLNLVDRNYRVFQIAATIDAQLLERRNEMNLTQTISRIYDDAHIKFFFQTVYIMFTLATLLLGWFILASNSYHLVLLVAFAVTAYDFAWALLYPGRSKALGIIVLTLLLAVLLYLSNFYIHVKGTSVIFYDVTKISLLLSEELRGPIHYHLVLLAVVTFAIAAILATETTVDIRDWVDFAIDAYEYQQGDTVLVTVTNIGRDLLTLRPDDPKNPKQNVLRVHRERDPRMEAPLNIPGLEISNTIEIPAASKRDWHLSWSDHRWQFSTANENLHPGLYRVVYSGPNYRRRGLFGYKLRDPPGESGEKRGSAPRKTREEETVNRVRRLIFRTLNLPNDGWRAYDSWKFAQRFMITAQETQSINLSISSSSTPVKNSAADTVKSAHEVTQATQGAKAAQRTGTATDEAANETSR